MKIHVTNPCKTTRYLVVASPPPSGFYLFWSKEMQDIWAKENMENTKIVALPAGFEGKVNVSIGSSFDDDRELYIEINKEVDAISIMPTKKLIMLRGLSASGKSTWAKQYVKDTPGTVRINKDDLRAMCHDSHWSRGNEKLICDMRDAMVAKALHSEHTVIVDDTNHAPAHEARLRQIALEEKALFEIKDFPIDFETAVERDLKRQRPVGYAVIKDQWNRYVRPTLKVEQDSSLPPCVIVDCDGTLALIGDRNPYDASSCESDLPNPWVIRWVKDLQKTGVRLVIFTGREEKYMAQTLAWLKEQGLSPDIFAMRKNDDNRKDAIIKEEMWRKLVLPEFCTELVIDDRDQVVSMYRNLGLNVWQVADGNF